MKLTFTPADGRPLVTLKPFNLGRQDRRADDNTGWITSERARAHVQQSALADAILTGIGTVG